MKYTEVLYKEDSQPVNDLERIMHNAKAEAEYVRQSLAEIKDMIREIKLILRG